MTKPLSEKSNKLKSKKLKDSISVKSSIAKHTEKKAKKGKRIRSNSYVTKNKRFASNVSVLSENHPGTLDAQVKLGPVKDSLCDDSDSSSSNHDGRAAQRAHRLLKNDRRRRTLFVGNLPLTTTRNDLRRLFNRTLKENKDVVEAGCRVECVRIRGFVPSSGGTGKLALRRAVIQGEVPAGVSRTLIAYVVLTSPVGIPTALKLNGHWIASTPLRDQTGQSAGSQPSESEKSDLAGRHIRVDCAVRSDSSKWASHSVFLGNLPFDVLEEEIRTALSVFGEISNVRLIRDRDTGAVKGFGYAQFTDPVSVSLAIRASETVTVRSRSIRIQEWHGPNDGEKGKKWKKAARHGAGHSPNRVTKPVTKPAGSAQPGTKCLNVQHRGRVKGITLPSNIRGPKREWILEKRLQKKRKRLVRRQQQRRLMNNHGTESGMKPRKNGKSA